jgi:hypothetical protein
MRTSYAVSIIFCILLASCQAAAPEPSVIQTAIAKTKASEPTAIPTSTPQPSPTSIPLSKINLEELILLKGDLSPEYVGGQIKTDWPKDIDAKFPDPDNLVQQSFRNGIFGSDGITIALYDSVSNVQIAYQAFTEAMSVEKVDKKNELSDIGEKAFITISAGGGFLNIPYSVSVKLVFMRCHSVVFIDLFASAASEDVAITYGKRLDKRLSPIVCR